MMQHHGASCNSLSPFAVPVSRAALLPHQTFVWCGGLRVPLAPFAPLYLGKEEQGESGLFFSSASNIPTFSRMLECSDMSFPSARSMPPTISALRYFRYTSAKLCPAVSPVSFATSSIRVLERKDVAETVKQKLRKEHAVLEPKSMKQEIDRLTQKVFAIQKRHGKPRKCENPPRSFRYPFISIYFAQHGSRPTAQRALQSDWIAAAKRAYSFMKNTFTAALKSAKTKENANTILAITKIDHNRPKNCFFTKSFVILPTTEVAERRSITVMRCIHGIDVLFRCMFPSRGSAERRKKLVPPYIPRVV